MAAVAPAQLGAPLDTNDVAMDGSDVDAEGEEDMDVEYSNAVAYAVNSNDAVEPDAKGGNGNENGAGSDNGPGEENEEASEDDLSEDSAAEDSDHEDAEEQDKEDGVVGAVKLPEGMDLDSDVESGAESGADDVSEDDNKSSHDSAASDSSDESVAAEEWEDASAGEGEADIAGRNNCIFCKLDEEHDPSEEFEEYLACSVCGDNSHKQCARDAKSLGEDELPSNWRCPQCVTNALVPEDNASLTRRLSTSSRLTRDLLPAQQPKPGAHNIFSNLLVEGDALDGSRSLRKRKSSSAELETSSKTSSKRRRANSNAVVSASSSASVSSDNESKHAIVLGQGTSRRRDRVAGNKPAASQETNSRTSRPRRQKHEAPRVRPLIRESHRFIIAIKVDLSQIKEKPPKKSRRSTVPSSHARFAVPTAMHYSAPLYSFHDREIDESKIKPYGGILSEAEADTSKTFPTPFDRARFEEARQKAEEEWKVKTAASEAENETKGRASAKISGPPSKIKCINFGGFEIDTWYAAPYPEEYSRNRVLYICEFCLKYMPSDYVAWRHKLKCPAKHPPGDEIYRDRSVSVFEVDGRKNPVYCQNLCLLAKLFLGSKTLYYDVEPFLFYIMTEYDDLGYHFVGYFSKEKRPSSMNNVSCILTLPIHQRKGYGNLLIDFSYLLTRVEQKTGSPEKPLSDMGLVSYRNYWRLQLAYKLLDQTEKLSIAKISELTGMTADDIIAALEALRALVRDPVTKTYALRLDRAFLKETIDKWEAKKYVKLNDDALIWTPYVMGHYNLTNYDRGGISTVAPREDEEDQAVPEEGVQKAAAAETEPKVNGIDTAEPPITPLHLNMNTSLPTESVEPVEVSSQKPNGIHLATPVKPPSPVPPTRYEIFPPIPGTIARRRTTKGGARRVYTPGSASVRRDRTATPRANGISPRHFTTPTTRKTRSALGNELDADKVEDSPRGSKKPTTDGDHEDEDEDDDDDGGLIKLRSKRNSKAPILDDEDEEDDAESDSNNDSDSDADVEPEAELEEGEDDADFEPDEGNDANGDDDEDEAEIDAEAESDVGSEDADGEIDDDVVVGADREGPTGEDDAEGEADAEGEDDDEDDDDADADADGESDPSAAGDEVEMIDT